MPELPVVTSAILLMTMVSDPSLMIEYLLTPLSHVVAMPLYGSNFGFQRRNESIITDVMCNGSQYELRQCPVTFVSDNDTYCSGGYNIAGVQCTDGECNISLNITLLT